VGDPAKRGVTWLVGRRHRDRAGGEAGPGKRGRRWRPPAAIV